ncbi:hypothetical protein B0H13DRAFT_2529730 [Mycena leptocephala]|nr:hypothetical protein B0H13DRAFT_2529730 [Mycena leptocephala]
MPFVFGAPPPAHPTLLHPCAPSSSPFASTSSTAAYAVLSPSYALHAAAPALPRTLLTRYPSTITPTSEYLRTPTNGYAHADAPRRFVHLVGPPLDLALDAWGVGVGAAVGISPHAHRNLPLLFTHIPKSHSHAGANGGDAYYPRDFPDTLTTPRSNPSPPAHSRWDIPRTTHRVTYFKDFLEFHDTTDIFPPADLRLLVFATYPLGNQASMVRLLVTFCDFPALDPPDSSHTTNCFLSSWAHLPTSTSLPPTLL